MGVTAGAHDLRSVHAIAEVFLGLDVFLVDRREKAWPAGTRFKLVVRAEKWKAAADARIRARLVVIPEIAAERGLGALPACDLILLGCELRPPLLVSLVNL